MTIKLTPAQVDNIVKRYRAGESILSIANGAPFSRPVITRVLRDRAGYRDRRRAALNRYKRMAPADRSALANNAHLAAAIAREKSGQFVGAGERKLAQWIRERGIEPVPQKAVGIYNIDVAIHPIAVEVHLSHASPKFSATCYRRRMERALYLIEAGWSILYVWDPSAKRITEGAADYAVAFLQETNRNPSAIGEYRVIRGSGELFAFGRPDGDKLTRVRARKQ